MQEAGMGNEFLGGLRRCPGGPRAPPVCGHRVPPLESGQRGLHSRGLVPRGFLGQNGPWPRSEPGAAGRGGTLLTLGAFRTESRAQVCASPGARSLLLAFSKGSGVCRALRYGAAVWFSFRKTPLPRTLLGALRLPGWGFGMLSGAPELSPSPHSCPGITILPPLPAPLSWAASTRGQRRPPLRFCAASSVPGAGSRGAGRRQGKVRVKERCTSAWVCVVFIAAGQGSSDPGRAWGSQRNVPLACRSGRDITFTYAAAAVAPPPGSRPAASAVGAVEVAFPYTVTGEPLASLAGEFLSPSVSEKS